MVKKLTIARLKNTAFIELYKEFLIEKEVTREKLSKILALMLTFTNSKDENINKLGYRIALLYSYKTQDYKPLYEISSNLGLFPISKNIFNRFKQGNIFNEIDNIIIDKYYNISGITRTAQQVLLFDEVIKNINQSHFVVAPTSYGKTELIEEIIEKLPKVKNICIITPTKSLLKQTKSRISKKFKTRKIISNPELYAGEENEIIAVMTQERYQRLLQKNRELKFDFLVIDEAHNLLDKGDEISNRSVLLASVIIISYTRNTNINCLFLTPSINNLQNLLPKYSSITPKYNRVTEIVKSEIFYFHDTLNRNIELYDQFLDEFFNINEKILNNEILASDELIVANSKGNKNIIYLNKPRSVQNFAKNLSSNLSEIKTERINKAIKNLENFVHKDYDLIECVKKGVVYHHGSMTENVREYVEYLYSNLHEIKYIVTTSTLLEGVNIPGDRLFILDPKKGNKKMNSTSFKNLIGRICRYNEIFADGTKNLNKLLPKIHIVKGDYCFKKFNARRFAHEVISIQSNSIDIVSNPLLINYQNQNDGKIEKANEYLENISNEKIIDKYQGRKVHTKVGKSMFHHNINSIDIFENENIIEKHSESISEIKDLNYLFDVLECLFFSRFKEDKSHENIQRLKKEKARDYYKILLNFRYNNTSTKIRIMQMVDYWNKSNKVIVYVGRWGDETRGGHRPFWTNIKNKSEKEKVNIAILRLKEEYDFIDNEIFKYIDVLFDIGLLEEQFYLKLRYGTNDLYEILLINYGFSYELTNLLKKYSKFITIFLEEKKVIIDDDLVQKMKNNKEDEMLIVEMIGKI